MTNNEIIEKIATEILHGSHISVLTGAGISTASGIKDFRSEDGLYNTANMAEFGNLQPEDMLSHSMLENHPDLFYKWYRRYMDVSEHVPNDGHLLLAQLEKEYGKDVQIFTQNIDGLHTAAGSTKVYELHGNGAVMRCEDCGRMYKTSGVFAPTWPYTWGEKPLCGCGSILRPDIVLYDEPINAPNQGIYGNMLRDCDVFLVMGTSMAVYPAASIPSYCPCKTSVYVINNKSYPEYREAMQNVKFTECIMNIQDFAVELKRMLWTLKNQNTTNKASKNC